MTPDSRDCGQEEGMRPLLTVQSRYGDVERDCHDASIWTPLGDPRQLGQLPAGW